MNQCHGKILFNKNCSMYVAEVENAIKDRSQTYYGIYADEATALGGFSTGVLAQYYIEKIGDSAFATIWSSGTEFTYVFSNGPYVILKDDEAGDLTNIFVHDHRTRDGSWDEKGFLLKWKGFVNGFYFRNGKHF